MQARAHVIPSLLVLALVAMPPAETFATQAPPPDLRLEWWVDGQAKRQAPAVVGRAGDSIELSYVLRNVGGSAAYAAVVESHTALGPVGEPKRIHPGPRAGEELRRTLILPLARGAREVCVLVRLQTLEVDSPADPHLEDNRLCRDVRVIPRGADGSPPSSRKATDDAARSARPPGARSGLYSARKGEAR